MDFHFSLLENGLDFVLSSLEHLTAASGTPPDPIPAFMTTEAQKRHLKYALLHLCSGIELIFKEGLRQEDWRLLFNDVAKADEETYESGDFQSVHFKEAQERLEEECAIELTPKQKVDLKSFRGRRNKIEHFGAVYSLLAVQASITQMVNFIVDFVEEAFEDDGLQEEEDLLSEIRTKLGSCNAVVKERWTLIQSEVDKRYSNVTCPSCRQEAMTADGGTVKCLFCNYQRVQKTQQTSTSPMCSGTRAGILSRKTAASGLCEYALAAAVVRTSRKFLAFTIPTTAIVSLAARSTAQGSLKNVMTAANSTIPARRRGTTSARTVSRPV